MIPQILGHYHIMTNFDCPNNANFEKPRVDVDVRASTSPLCQAATINPCGRAHNWLLDDWPQVETTLEPHDCSKMEKEKALVDLWVGTSREPKEWRRIADPTSKSSRRLSPQQGHLLPSFEKWSPYRQCKVQNDLLLINHKPNFFKPWFIQLTEICVVI